MTDLRLTPADLVDILEDMLSKRTDKHPLLSNLDWHEQIFTRKANLKELFCFEPSAVSSQLIFKRDEDTGRLNGFEEKFLSNVTEFEDDIGGRHEMRRANNSLSMHRMPSLDQSIRGNPAMIPFQPANLKSFCENQFPHLMSNYSHQDELQTSLESELIDFDNLLRTPPSQQLDGGLVNNLLNDEEKELFRFNDRINGQLFDDIGNYAVHKQDRRREEIEHNLLSLELERLSPAVKSISIKDQKIPEGNIRYVQMLDANIDVEDFKQQVPNPAKEFQYELDPFQKKAILCLEQKKNVLVAAHTSAGKTTVAEYAIALALRNLTRVIYTSPIKALSNQKFREFRNGDKFGRDNIGLLTGDIQLNIDAPCLIMTTEILLQMLYNGSEVIRDLEWVIFDEVHYVNDKERGHIWEEIFILLPDHINLVLLSATVSNITQFGGWLGKARNKTTYVVYTLKRPVPLEHFLYLGTDGRTEQYFKFLDKDGRFDQTEYRKAGNLIKDREQKKTTGNLRNKQKSGAAGAKTKTLMPKPSGFKNNCNATERNQYIGMIRNLQTNKKLPLIVFVFSRLKCNELAQILGLSMDLCRVKEKFRIHQTIERSLRNLKQKDRELPQVIKVTTLLKNGFGVHHSGILPLLRELTEILFSAGLVKVLFATETFAMGVNMPAKTVTFDSLEKHDGSCKRDLLPSEYIQMAGRAGRRGTDDTGNVIIFCKETIPDTERLTRITTNKVYPIESKFRLTYQMMLNILRARNHLKIESIMEKAFSEHKMQSQLEEWFQEKNQLEQDLKSTITPDCAVCKEDLEAFSIQFHRYQLEREEFMVEVCCSALANKKILETGRLIIFEGQTPFQVGVILKVRTSPSLSKTELRVIGFDLLELIEFLGRGEKIKSTISFIELKHVDCILKINLSGFIAASVTDDVENPERSNLCQLLYEKITDPSIDVKINSTKDLFQFPHYHPSKDLKMIQYEFYVNYDRFTEERNNLINMKCVNCKHFGQHLSITLSRVSREARLNNLYYLLSAENLQCLPEYQKRLEILMELGYLNKELILTMKGKVACLISEHELIITDLLVDNFLHDLTPPEIVAVMSCFMFQQKVNDARIENERLWMKINQVVNVAKKIDSIQYRYGLTQNKDEVQESLKYGLVDVVYQWGKGLPFIGLMRMTTVQEGIIVRCIQRIDELLKELIAAANLIGDIELAAKIKEASKCIRRDIVFSVSLYVTSKDDA